MPCTGAETSTLYQYVKTSGGSQYKWNLYHRGRQGDDTMALVIGPKQKYNPKKTSRTGKDQFMKIADKGCSTSYSKVRDFIQDNYQNIDK